MGKALALSEPQLLHPHSHVGFGWGVSKTVLGNLDGCEATGVGRRDPAQGSALTLGTAPGKGWVARFTIPTQEGSGEQTQDCKLFPHLKVIAFK